MIRRAKFYRGLWQEAEEARKASDADLRALAQTLRETVAAMDGLARLLQDDPNPLVRGEARKMLSALERRP